MRLIQLRLTAVAIFLSAAGAAGTLHTAALAQAAGPAVSNAPDKELVDSGKRVWQGRAGCYNCHGWAGNGQNALNYPSGANLRETTLSAEQIAEVVRCGRPGTEMPFHERSAYTEGH